ncbi:MAG TPA: hypothetical protein VFV68_10575, partial [Agriterribacter sp.]|nr:hypothetical protein [Agriterribacter sp.]
KDSFRLQLTYCLKMSTGGILDEIGTDINGITEWFPNSRKCVLQHMIADRLCDLLPVNDQLMTGFNFYKLSAIFMHSSVYLSFDC